ncbi:ribonuclease R [Mycoplasmopsis fermentans]|uniref:ribonuclease R n=1 Tax=Mycoplasmopsis fermentans TaxID=2115 RepID=UPI0001E32FE3|nr:ribonuclease R [Mycoplasmopsis fermentans]ADN69300.1 exoribonuclease II [Mycoplasmopsis fermentans JER]RMX34880.1 ribonuclease R [Mycoplasmopsis fermentans MF-I2]
MNPQEILNFLKKHDNSTFIDIAKGLRISYKDNKKLTELLNKLIDERKLIKNGKLSTYSLIEKIKIVQGKIRFASEGKYAFVEEENDNPEAEKISYFVPGIHLNRALDGDFVEITVLKYFHSLDDKTFAIVEKVLSRNSDKFIGILGMHEGFLSFKPLKNDYKKINFHIKELVKEARLHDVVLGQMVSFKNNIIELNIIKKIANSNDPMAYVKALTVIRNEPEDFPQEVKDYLVKIPNSIADEKLNNRLDLRKELIVTIDGNDTKDFDDAINVKKNADGTYELGVHIADVSYYVKEDSSLDVEALKRGTSRYLVSGVIPMLPHKLSNGICSLNPNEDRFTLSAIMTIDKNGDTIDAKFYQSIIQSKYRLTYDRVNELYDKNQKFDDPKLNRMLYEAAELAKIIRNYKVKEGYIDFEIEEPEIVLDDKGKTIDVVVKPTGFSENLIEDFMVRTNEEVAKFLAKRKIPFIYRVHESPDSDKIDSFLSVLNVLGIKVNIDRNDINPKSFQKIINKIKETRNDDFLKTVFLRTMQKAKYSPNNIGHFGLASEHYCHFTSPIRRYPDLVVHRILREIVFNNDKSKITHYKNILSNVAELNSNSEQEALQLERDTNDLKYAEFFKNKIGQTMKAQIISILRFGMFVQFDCKIEALVHISTLCDGDYEVNENFTELRSKQHTFKLGDQVEVVIAGADETNGKIDAVLAKCYGSYLEEIKKKLNSNSNRKHKKSGK